MTADERRATINEAVAAPLAAVSHLQAHYPSSPPSGP